MEETLSPFEFHGVDFSRKTTTQWQGSCPFCDKPDHFHVNPTEGKKRWCWDCKRCGESGNLYTFLNKHHEKWLHLTEPENYASLSAVRGGIPPIAFKRADLAYNTEMGCWLLPIRSDKDRITNLKKWYPNQSKPRLLGTPECSQTLYGLESLEPSGIIYLCEGEWDAIALQWLLAVASSVRAGSLVPYPYSVLAVPGSNVFKRDWGRIFTERPSVLIYDQDAAGRKGVEKVYKILRKYTSNLLYVQWPDDTPNKYDIRDFICDARNSGDRPRTIYQNFTELLSSDPIGGEDGTITAVDEKPVVERVPVKDFDEVVDSFKSCIHVDNNFVDALTVATATTISVRIPGDPIWMFMVGPPSSGKTTLVEAFLGTTEYCEGISKLSATALISGYRAGSGQDCSFLPKLKNKTLVVKDYTAIKKMPITVQEELYGLLRDVYDGHCRIPYGTSDIRDYSDIRFSALAAVTDIIHGDNRATLGERFLKVELLGDDFDPDKQILAAIEGTTHKAERMRFLQGVMLAFLDKETDTERIPNIPDWTKKRLVGLSQVVGHLRAQVEREQGMLRYRPRPEVGARIASQLVRLGMATCYVLNKPEVDERVYYLMEKVALDTAIGFNLEIIMAIAMNETGYSVVKDLETRIQLSKSTIERHLNNMQELGIVRNRRSTNGKKGHPIYQWSLGSSFQEKWDQAGLFRRSIIEAKMSGEYSPM